MTKPTTTPPQADAAPKQKYMQVQLLVTLEFADGDFAAVPKAMAHIALAAENVTIDHKGTKTVRR